MDYINHINKYDNSAAIQAALDAGTLVNPYVAMTSAGTIDYNSLQPTPPVPPAPSKIGDWTDDSAGHYTFEMLDTDPDYWKYPAKIGTILNVYYYFPYGEWGQVDSDVILKYDLNEHTYNLYLVVNNEFFEPYQFTIGSEYTWEIAGMVTDRVSSDAAIQVEWDGVSSFVFSSKDSERPVSITTYDINVPEQPEYMGSWTHDASQGQYNFTVEEPDFQYWGANTLIGTFEDVYVEGSQTDVSVYLMGLYDGSWQVSLDYPGVSDQPTHVFTYSGELWEDTGILVDPNESYSKIMVMFKGIYDSHFVFNSDDLYHPLTMTTVNPPYPEASE